MIFRMKSDGGGYLIVIHKWIDSEISTDIIHISRSFLPHIEMFIVNQTDGVGFFLLLPYPIEPNKNND